MTQDLGEGIFEIRGDTTDVDRAIDRTETRVRGLGGTFDGLAGKLTVAAAVGGAALGALGIKSVSVAADFERAIDQVGAVAQATEGQMASLSDAALRIGKDTAFSATEAASSMELLAANGLTVDQILNGAADATVALAAAGGTSLPIAADVASTAMKVWGLEGDKLTDVVNRVAGAANVSRFGVEDMSYAISQGGGIAAAMGVKFEDFSTAIAASADLFSGGADAGTSFKSMLQHMVAPMGAGAKAIKALNLQFYDANGQLKAFPDLADELNRKLSGLDDSERNKMMSNIFGSDGIRAAIGLMRQGKDGFLDMQAAMGNTDAAAIAKVRMGNLRGALEELSGTVETLQIKFGKLFIPILTKVTLAVARGLTPAIDGALTKLKPFEPMVEGVGRNLDALARYLYAVVVEGDDLNDWLTHMGPNMAAVAYVVAGVATNLWDMAKALGNAVMWVADAVVSLLRFVGILQDGEDATGKISSRLGMLNGTITVLTSAIVAMFAAWVFTQLVSDAIWATRTITGAITGPYNAVRELQRALSELRDAWRPVQTAAEKMAGAVADQLYLARIRASELKDELGKALGLLVDRGGTITQTIIQNVRRTGDTLLTDFSDKIQHVTQIVTAQIKEKTDAKSVSIKIATSMAQGFASGLAGAALGLIAAGAITISVPALIAVGIAVAVALAAALAYAFRDHLLNLFGQVLGTTGAIAVLFLAAPFILISELLKGIAAIAPVLYGAGKGIADSIWSGLQDAWGFVTGKLPGIVANAFSKLRTCT
jgi:TP901 family phage tail tape measure protein